MTSEFHFTLTQEQATAFGKYQAQGYTLGRVAEEHTHVYTVWTEAGEIPAEVSGKFRFEATRRQDFPSVGDYVVLNVRNTESRGTIHAVLPRLSRFLRKSAGSTTDEQIVAANVNTLFLVMSLNFDLNLRRLERYLIMAWDSGANPVIVLTKADLCADAEAALKRVQSVAIGIPIHIVSSFTGDGVDGLYQYLGAGQTGAFVGSSGVGKSTLINYLVGQDVQSVNSVREDDDKGRHTTTSRTLLQLPTGGSVIDTPGMRELQLWETGDGLDDTFGDILALGEACQFRDCLHESEPGCEVQAAIRTGALAPERLNSYRKLQRELAHIARKEDARARMIEHQKHKKMSQNARAHGHRR